MIANSVLVVEDDRFIGEMYVRSLQKNGSSVDWMTNGSDAIAAATSKPYDLILLDIMLPAVRGTDIAKILRSEKAANPEAKIIVLTNFDQDEKSRIEMEGFVDSYQIKADITPRKLLDIIAAL